MVHEQIWGTNFPQHHRCRDRKATWKEFLTRHSELIVAADFFTVEAWTARGLQRFIVLFLIELSTREVEIAGLAPVYEWTVEGPARRFAPGRATSSARPEIAQYVRLPGILSTRSVTNCNVPLRQR